MNRIAALALAIVAVCVLASPALASDKTLKATFLRGVALAKKQEVKGGSIATLAERLELISARIGADKGTTARGRTGRTLAVSGFKTYGRALDLRLDSSDALESCDALDTECIEEAFAILRRSDSSYRTAHRQLRAAGTAFGVRVAFPPV